MTIFQNIPFDQLRPGMSAEARRICRADDLYIFANTSGNLNPMHLPKEDGDGDGVPEAVAPAMWVAALISSVLGNELPGPGTLYRSQNLTWHNRTHAGDELVIRVEVLELLPDNVVKLATSVSRSDGKPICEGEAKVTAPSLSQTFEADEIPGLTVRRHVHFDAMIERAEPLDPMPTAVVVPEGAAFLGGAILGWEHTLITPILIGDEAVIRATAEEIGKDVSGLEIIHEPDHAQAARRGVALVHDGRAASVMKGNLHTDVLLGAIVKRDTGLRTGRRLSHVFVMDVPGLPHLLMITDAAINIAPDLETKVDITQNAIDLAKALGIEVPKVGVLSAVETVNTKIPSTLDAAILSKMAERGQIRGGVVDGPLAMDNAIDMAAARTKGIESDVAGRAEILIVPNLEAGNMLAKELTFVAHAEAGGIVLGAKVPIILTSRADDDKARLASCAVAALYNAHGKAVVGH
ncbi:MAG: bifunctional enoyl-CoA hydratase/phosphate acetyltransferase [Pseudomonadota bacterium]